MADYKFFKDISGTKNVGVIFKDIYWIPFDPANTDYQTYLEWAKTNTTDPADKFTFSCICLVIIPIVT